MRGVGVGVDTQFLLSRRCMMGGGSVLKYGCCSESWAEIRSAGTSCSILCSSSSVLAGSWFNLPTVFQVNMLTANRLLLIG